MTETMTWTVPCVTCGVVFFIFAVIFAVFKEKATPLISGFNTLSREEQAKYDRAAMARDYRNMFLLWAAVMLTGALFCLRFGLPAFCVTFAVWILTTRSKIHFSVEKAFGKYKLDQDRKDF